MIVAIANIHLYTAFDATALDGVACYNALTAAEKDFVHLHYTDPAQCAAVLTAVSSWRSAYDATEPDAGMEVDAFPFVTYDERHDDYSSIRRVVEGKDAILDLLQNSVI
jgi:hypothetical protein